MQTNIKIGFKCVDVLDCMVIHCEVIRNIAMSSNFLNTLYALTLQKDSFSIFVLCTKFSAKLILGFLSKQQTTITPVNFLKSTSPYLFLSVTVDTWLIISLYGSAHEDVHFYWLNTEMIGILRQMTSTSTETEISQTGTKRDMIA